MGKNAPPSTDADQMDTEELLAKLRKGVSDVNAGRIYDASKVFALQRKILNEATLKAMEDAENGEEMIGPFDTIAEMIDALNAEDGRSQ